MAKKIAVLLGTLAVLVGALLVYRQFAEPMPERRTPGSGDAVRPEGRTSQQFEDVRIGAAKGLEVYAVDEESGRRSGKYTAEIWEPAEDGGVHYLTRPRFERYLEDGRILYLWAEEGVLEAEMVAGDINPRHATLTGGVHVCIDRAADAVPLDPEQLERRLRLLPDDFVHVRMERAEFQNDLQEIDAPGEVEFDTREMRVVGRDLTLRWDSDPWKLRYLKLEQGDLLEIRRSLGRFGGVLPTGRGEEPSNDAPANATTRPAIAPVASGPQPDADDASNADEESPRQYYRVTLHEEVRIDSGSQWLRDADRVSMTLAYEPGTSLEESNGSAASQPARPGQGRPATQPADTAEASGSTIVHWSGPLVIQPLEETAIAPPPGEVNFFAEGKRVTLGNESMVAVCEKAEYRSGDESGALDGLNQPVRLVFDRGNAVEVKRAVIDQVRRKVHLQGEGFMVLSEQPSGMVLPADVAGPRPASAPAVTVADAGSRRDVNVMPDRGDAEGVRVGWKEGVDIDYAVPSGADARIALQEAVFRGNVDFSQPDGNALSADWIRLLFVDDGSRPLQLVTPASTATQAVTADLPKVEAPATAPTTFSARATSGPPASAPASAPASQPSARSTAAEVEPPTSAPAIDRPDDRSLRIHLLEAEGDVWLRDRSAEGNEVRADELKARMGLSTDEEIYPELVWAGGNVKARQAGSSIAAGVLTVAFRPALPDERDAGESRFIAETLTAGRGVTIRDGDEGGAVIGGESLESNLPEHTHIVRGAPARIEQGGNRIEGPIIRYDERSMVARIEGAGDLKFASSTDLNGRRLDQPRTIQVNWSDELIYRDKAGLAEFVGNVSLRSGPDSMRADRMTVELARPEPGSAAAAGSDEAVGIEARSDLRTLHAVGNVRVDSVRMDAEGFLEQRFGLRAADLTYNAALSSMTAEGRGLLSVEDYRPASPSTSGEAEPRFLEGNSGPMQAVITFNEGMQFLQSMGSVTFRGAVRLERRSGSVIARPKSLPIRSAPDGPPGRSSLTCGVLTARFDTRSSDGAAAAVGLSIGRLMRFEAVGNPFLTDGPYQAMGARILYERVYDTAVVYGESGNPARVYYEDPPERPFMREEGDEITVFRRNGRLQVHVRGGRGAGTTR